MIFFGCEAVFGSTLEAEKISEGYKVRCFDGAVTSQFVIDKDLCEARADSSIVVVQF